MQIVIASKNLNKVREYRTFLKKIDGLDVMSLMDFPNYKPLEEMGKSFEDNAKNKALHAATSLNCFAIADDSGLVVPALNGEPGLYSARYAGQKATDRDNRAKLVEKVKRLNEDARAAYFECVTALCSPEGNVRVARGICEGKVLAEEKGSKGFGYDSMFVKYDYSRTFGELDEEMKNEISHRRKAFDKLLPHIETYIHMMK